MTNPMLAELDEVVRLIERHDFLERLDAHDAATQLSLGFTQMAARFFRTHHAPLADMAKRLEAAERDSKRATRIYTLSLYDEHGAECMKATTDKSKVPAMLESYNGSGGVWGDANIQVDDDDRESLARLLAEDEPGKHDLCRGWGGFQLHIVESFESPAAIDTTQEGEG